MIRSHSECQWHQKFVFQDRSGKEGNKPCGKYNFFYNGNTTTHKQSRFSFIDPVHCDVFTIRRDIRHKTPSKHAGSVLGSGSPCPSAGSARCRSGSRWRSARSCSIAGCRRRCPPAAPPAAPPPPRPEGSCAPSGPWRSAGSRRRTRSPPQSPRARWRASRWLLPAAVCWSPSPRSGGCRRSAPGGCPGWDAPPGRRPGRCQSEWRESGEPPAGLPAGTGERLRRAAAVSLPGHSACWWAAVLRTLRPEEAAGWRAWCARGGRASPGGRWACPAWWSWSKPVCDHWSASLWPPLRTATSFPPHCGWEGAWRHDRKERLQEKSGCGTGRGGQRGGSSQGSAIGLWVRYEATAEKQKQNRAQTTERRPPPRSPPPHQPKCREVTTS